MSNGINYYEVLQLAGIEVIKSTIGPGNRPALWFRFEPSDDRKLAPLESGETDFKVSVDDLLTVLNAGTRLLDAGVAVVPARHVRMLEIELDIARKNLAKRGTT
jgi:hypothetical protein